MASTTTSTVAFFLALNLVFFSLVSSSSCHDSCSKPKPKIKPCPTPPGAGKCPIDAVKLGVCANVLNGLLNVVVGAPPKSPCCTLVNGLADLEAAVCLCTALKANLLGIKLNVPVSLSLLVNYCGKKIPAGFRCL